jgi:hypothetical protein
MATKSVKKSPAKAKKSVKKASPKKSVKKSSPKKSVRKASPKKSTKSPAKSTRKRGSPKLKSAAKKRVSQVVSKHFRPGDARKMILFIAREEGKSDMRVGRDVYEPVSKAVERMVEVVFSRIHEANPNVTTFNEEVFKRAFPLVRSQKVPIELREIVIKKYVKEHISKLSDKKRPRVVDEFRHLIRSLIFNKMRQYIYALLEVTGHSRHRRTVRGEDAILLNHILDTWACV